MNLRGDEGTNERCPESSAISDVDIATRSSTALASHSQFRSISAISVCRRCDFSVQRFRRQPIAIWSRPAALISAEKNVNGVYGIASARGRLLCNFINARRREHLVDFCRPRNNGRSPFRTLFFLFPFLSFPFLLFFSRNARNCSSARWTLPDGSIIQFLLVDRRY